jgi:F0F1-type ATP synthase membrane subunit b/b'
MKTWNIIAAALLILTSSAFAQNPIDDVTGSIQEQINTMGQQLQKGAVQHIVEGNLTSEHISQELNATKQDLTEKAREKMNQELNENLNLTPEQIQQKAAEDLKRQVSQQVPGFDSLIAMIGLLGVILATGRKK